MNEKMMMRKKAIDSLMKEKPSMDFKRKPEAEALEKGGEGMESIMVTAEEKKMIMDMRENGEEGGEEAEEEAAPVDEMGVE